MIKVTFTQRSTRVGPELWNKGRVGFFKTEKEVEKYRNLPGFLIEDNVKTPKKSKAKKATEEKPFDLDENKSDKDADNGLNLNEDEDSIKY